MEIPVLDNWFLRESVGSFMHGQNSSCGHGRKRHGGSWRRVFEVEESMRWTSREVNGRGTLKLAKVWAVIVHNEFFVCLSHPCYYMRGLTPSYPLTVLMHSQTGKTLSSHFFRYCHKKSYDINVKILTGLCNCRVHDPGSTSDTSPLSQANWGATEPLLSDFFLLGFTRS